MSLTCMICSSTKTNTNKPKHISEGPGEEQHEFSFAHLCNLCDQADHFLHLYSFCAVGPIWEKEEQPLHLQQRVQCAFFCSFKDLILKSGAQECKWDKILQTTSEYDPSTITHPEQ